MMGENIIRSIRPADIITLISAIMGFGSIIMTGSGQHDTALVLILAAVIADAADGAVARKFGSGVMGASLDSLADVISFGVAPAFASFAYLGSGTAAWAAAGLFLLCGILRLARFNVAGKKNGFDGIPITSGGFVVALFILSKDYFMYAEYALLLLLVILSFLMISSISYPKPKNPIIIAPAGIVLAGDIASYYLGFPGFVKTLSLFLLIFAFAYILSPIWRRFYDRDK